MRLAETLDLNAAAPLCSQILASRGQDLALDASAVRRIGALCTQILLSARATWAADGFALRLVEPSQDLRDGLALMGCADLADANPVQDHAQ